MEQNLFELNSLLTEDDVNIPNDDLDLFGSDDEDVEEENNEETDSAEKDNPSENVGNDDVNNEENEESTNSSKNSASPNIYASIANVLQEEGTFPDLKSDEINDSESFIEAIQEQIKNSIDEEYQRINSALSVGVKPDVINSHRNTIKYLESLNQEDVENEDNVELRKNLIMQDYINRGYSNERAEKAYQKSLDRGDDVEDALEALDANKEFFTNQYNSLLDNAKAEEAKRIEANKKRAKEFKQSIMEDKKLYGDFEVSKSMRQEIYDSLTKPIYTDKNTGVTYTAIQKWQLDDPDTFNKALGLIYKLTNGGKDFNNLINKEVKKKVSKARNEFENAIRSNTVMEGGRLRLANASNDSESYLKGFELDI